MRKNFSFKISRKSLLITFFAVFISLGSMLTVNAQKRDNLTDEEDMLVRDAQEIDARMNVFVKVVERRLLALTDPNAAQSKSVQKKSGDWGALRTGTRAELLFDIQKTIDEAIAKIDDAAERDRKNPLFPKAVHILAEGCGKFIPQLKSFKLEDQSERDFAENSIDECNQVIEASSKVAKPDSKTDKKKKN